MAYSDRGTLRGNEEEHSKCTHGDVAESHRRAFHERSQTQGTHGFRSRDVRERAQPLVGDGRQGCNRFWQVGVLTGRGCHGAFQEDEIAVYLDLGAGGLGVGVIKQSPSWTLQTRALYGLLTIASGLGNRRWAIHPPGPEAARDSCLRASLSPAPGGGDTGEIGLPRKGRRLN